MSELILYQTEDGKAQVRLRAEAGSVWLTQGEIAELFATLHAANVLKEEELDEHSVVKESLTTAADGKSNYQGILDSCRSRKKTAHGKITRAVWQ